MESLSWTRDDLVRFVDGDEVQVLTPLLGTLTTPEWLGDRSAGPWSVTATEGFSTTHPDDQAVLLAWWFTVLNHPGEVAECEVRDRSQGQWVTYRVRAVNLADHEDVGGVLACLRATGSSSALDDDEVPTAHFDESVDWVLAEVDRVGHILHIEGKVRELFGRDPDQLIGHSAIEYIHPDAVASVVPHWLQLIAVPGSARSSRRCLVHPDGTEVWVELNYLNRFDEDGNGDVLLVAYDITARRDQEQALLRSNEEIHRLAERHGCLAREADAIAGQFRVLADRVPAGVFRCDPDGRVTFSNAGWATLFGEDGPGGPEAPVTHVQDAVHADDRVIVEELLATVVGETHGASCAVEVRACDAQRVLRVRCRPISDSGATAPRIIGSIDDITTIVRLREAARLDPLTGLLNRAALQAHLRLVLADGRDDAFVLFVDLDDFKQVNDLHGHDGGDVVLAEIARRLQAGVRPDDVVARYGGDEFVVVCRGISPDSVASIRDRLAARLAGPIRFVGGQWEARASIGTTAVVGDEDVDAVLRRADEAMYAVKRARTAGRVAR
jgi:diguanylate cyclase (GGDEF)-like protein/PAS domain S-box-containing protein